MDALAEQLDAKRREWPLETASQVRCQRRGEKPEESVEDRVYNPILYSEGNEIAQENRQQKMTSVLGELFVSWFPTHGS